MARRYIKDLTSGLVVEEEIYLLTQKDLRSANNGSLYIHAVLADRTGQLPARMWQASQELYGALPSEGFVKVRGRTESYKGALQFIIDAIQPVDAKGVAVEEFLPKTDKDVEQMFKRVLEILRRIKDRGLLFLIKQFVEDRELMDRFRRAPAATQMHHACIGGLLEHTLNLLELALVVGPRYPQINMDLMLAGTFLHDMGKTAELTWESAFKYTDQGQLVGHLVLGAMMVEQRAKAAEAELGQPIPDRVIRVLQHIILSHHGEHEFGSPKLPMTAEAIALHHLDNLDAKLELIRRQIADSAATDPGSDWTAYVKSLERRIFRGDVFDQTDSKG